MFDNLLERLIYVLPAIVVALTFHEYAHGRVSYAFGDPTAKEAGRLSLNPLRHLDVVGTVLLIVAGFGWAKPVPVNPWYYGSHRKQKLLLVSLAGPLTNVLEALVGGAVLALFIHFSKGWNVVAEWFFNFLQYYISINAVLAVFNLIPIPPLDGSKILAGLLPDSAAYFIYNLERYGFLILLVLMFLPDVLGIFGLPEFDLLSRIISTPAQWLTRAIYHLYGLL